MNDRAYKQNIVTGGIVVLFGAAAFILAKDMPDTAPIFPRIASSLIMLLGALLALTSFIRMKRGIPTEEKAFDPENIAKPLILAAMILIYVLGIKLIGFYVVTLLVLVIYMWILGIRSIKPLVITTVIVMVLIYAVFTIGLKVPLPKGLLF